MTMPDLWVVNEHLTDGYAVYDRSARTYVTPTRTTLDEARDDFAELIAAGLPTASDVLVALAEAELAVIRCYFENSGGNVHTVFVDRGDREIAIGPFLDDGRPADERVWVDSQPAFDVAGVVTLVRQALSEDPA